MSIPKTHFTQLIPPRLAEVARRMRAGVWEFSSEPLELVALPATRAHQNYRDLDWSAAEPIPTLPIHWGRIFEQRWFRLEAPGSEQWTYLFWRDQGEATLYADGVPWSGFDVAHRYVRLPESGAELTVEAICCQSAIWHPDATGIDVEGSRLEGAFPARRDEAAWQALIDFQVLLDLAVYLARRDGFDPADVVNGQRYRRPLLRLSPEARFIFAELDRIADAFDRGGVGAIGDDLLTVRRRLEGGDPTMTVTLTGHAHIDLVWLWPRRIGEAKAVHSFATANRLMEQFPEFRFGYSQSASYEAVERRSPELMKHVNARIAERRWEPCGAMYVESDTQLACGEALLRSLLLGQDGFRKLTGSDSRVVWLPDVFGYTGCLPKLMRETGAKYFFTTKQAWSNSTHFPFSSFQWRGNDGTEVTAHVLHSLLANCYNTTTAIDEIVEPTLSHQQAGVHPESLVPVGYGDGGGGPTEEMCERVRRLGELQGVPPTKWGRIDDFFDRMNPAALPVWHGEIYLEFHRGVQTTQAALKQSFRSLERSLQQLEAVAAATGQDAGSDELWKKMVFAQFHDFIPGSSVHEVYDEEVPDLDRAAVSAFEKTADLLAGDVTGLLFNPHAYPVESARLQDGVVQKVTVPALATTDWRGATTFDTICSADGLTLHSDRVDARFSDGGEIEELKFDGKSVAIRQPLNQLRIYPDHPLNFEAWDIDRQTVSNPLEPIGPARLFSSECDGLTARIEFELPLTARSSARISYLVRVGDPVLHVSYLVDWQDESHLLQVLFPTEYNGRDARFGAPFGSALRPQIETTIGADAQFEVPASRWGLVADECETAGLAVIAKDRYGFGCRDGLMHVSLVRSALVTDARRNPELRDRDYIPDFSDLGEHRLELALAWGGLDQSRQDQPAALADWLYTPMMGAKAEVASVIRHLIGGETLIPGWAKPADDGNGFILRLHETRGQRGEIRLKLAEGWCAIRTSAVESECAPIEDGVVTFIPHDICSIRICRE